MSSPANPFLNPVGEAFARIVEDPEFAAQVRNDADTALASYSLSDEDREALVADAHALDVDVEGFALRSPGSKSFADLMGGLRTPGVLGINAQTYGWTQSLTRI